VLFLCGWWLLCQREGKGWRGGRGAEEAGANVTRRLALRRQRQSTHYLPIHLRLKAHYLRVPSGYRIALTILLSHNSRIPC
jgi:hypothetical protein